VYRRARIRDGQQRRLGGSRGRSTAYPCRGCRGRAGRRSRRLAHGERGNRSGAARPGAPSGCRRAGTPSADGAGTGRRARSSPSPGKPDTWQRGPASPQRWSGNVRSPWVNTDDLAREAELYRAERRVLSIQTKLHQWATDDPDRRFADLFTLSPTRFSFRWPGIGCGAIEDHARPGSTGSVPAICARRSRSSCPCCGHSSRRARSLQSRSGSG